MTTTTNQNRSGEADHGVVIDNQWYEDWVKDNISDLSGKVAIITGSNSGTGFWAANALASKGCVVVLACRNLSKAKAAADEIVERFPNAIVDPSMKLDNMDLDTVRSFVKDFKNKYDRLDYLLNNAGIMAQPLNKSKDGYDVQFQTNHLSHFLLTELLWETILQTPGQSRIVQHSSGAHYMGCPRFDKDNIDHPSYNWGWFGMNFVLWRVLLPVMGMKPYDNWARYGQSKLCNVLFAKELARRIDSSNNTDKVLSLACHPGYANTNLQNVAKDSMSNWEKSNQDNSQSAADGSLPLLLATLGPEIQNGNYTGPKENFKGPPIVTPVGGNGNDESMAKELWEYSEECIGTKFEV